MSVRARTSKRFRRSASCPGGYIWRAVYKQAVAMCSREKVVIVMATLGQSPQIEESEAWKNLKPFLVIKKNVRWRHTSSKQIGQSALQQVTAKPFFRQASDR